MKMIKSSKSLFSYSRQWQLISFLILGLLIFSLNSIMEVNYFIKHYLLILEIQTGIVCLYFLSLKLKTFKHKNSNFIRK